jgi:hypothetical protein
MIAPPFFLLPLLFPNGPSTICRDSTRCGAYDVNPHSGEF